jgi:hypothetical protein
MAVLFLFKLFGKKFYENTKKQETIKNSLISCVKLLIKITKISYNHINVGVFSQ